MFYLIDNEIVNYCEEHSTPENNLLYQLNRETHLKILSPRMLSGHLQGALLSLISSLIKPNNILEIGTYTGYASLCLAEGLRKDGTLDTIEINVELEEIIRKYFQLSPFKEQIVLHIGNALHIIPKLDKKWDLVFIDGEKRDLITLYQLILPKVRKNGIIIVDNVLWSGKVIEKVQNNDRETQIIMDFNDFIQNDKNVKNLMLPLRDGLTIIQKI